MVHETALHLDEIALRRRPRRSSGSAACSASGGFGRSGLDIEVDVTGAEDGVMGGEAHLAGLLSGANPDGACASDERERIVADEMGGSGEFEADGIVGEGANGVEFVGDAQDNACGIGSVGDQRGVIGQQSEFLIDALAGKTARDDLLALDVSVDAQIAPGANAFT